MAKKGGNTITKDQVGAWSFILGLALAIVLAFVVVDLAWLLVLLGIIVGLLNIQDKETTNFLLAALVLVGVSLNVNILGIPQIMSNIAFFVSPAAVIVAVKAVYTIGRK
jgi:chromate transport protein ChrA